MIEFVVGSVQAQQAQRGQQVQAQQAQREQQVQAQQAQREQQVQAQQEQVLREQQWLVVVQQVCWKVPFPVLS
jgi:hypothetical protein